MHKKAGYSIRSGIGKRIANRDYNKCRLCLREEDLQIHHITPLSLG